MYASQFPPRKKAEEIGITLHTNKRIAVEMIYALFNPQYIKNSTDISVSFFKFYIFCMYMLSFSNKVELDLAWKYKCHGNPLIKLIKVRTISYFCPSISHNEISYILKTRKRTTGFLHQ